MDYNTQRPRLILPEYGRVIHQMVEYCCTIEDRETRTKAANAIIELMGNMNPHLRDVPDFKHKLWDHLALMSDFKLDIDWPYPLPEKNILNLKPEKLPYSDGEIKYRHYGKIIEKLVKKIPEIEDPKAQRALIELMANHMKRSYMTWKKENINDEIIIKELNRLLENKVPIPEDLVLNEFRDVLASKQVQQNSQKKKKKSQKKR
ncbi:MAG: DUF4290 domain-containing protein [Bacteroidales bacterium]|jgi:hypothetical protein|nr:DUF4290 domain-containing protein [Bacteroidales bacterium]HOM35667.1 DUF4290 domain-containing protein [Bacteroidales bacterium]HPD22772.1 DUF4290 domain-containing protein [Bacteroidales bacterium]HRS98965.1 DUF4290 domain-containing protein [Bacteroidales bacterium]HRT81382.1 DUF4290 domain-containing protein [Bacteroidales bacterium]